MKVVIFNLDRPDFEQLTSGAFPTYKTTYKQPLLNAYAINHSKFEFERSYHPELGPQNPDYKIVGGEVSFISGPTFAIINDNYSQAARLEIYYSGIKDYSLLFPHIKEEKLKIRLGDFAEEADKAFENNAWMSYVMMVGAVIEGQLFAKFENDNFKQLISKALLSGIINEQECKLINEVKDMRNRIHASKYDEAYAGRAIALDIGITYEKLLKHKWD